MAVGTAVGMTADTVVDMTAVVEALVVMALYFRRLYH